MADDAVAKAKAELNKANKLSSEADPTGSMKKTVAPNPMPKPAAPAAGGITPADNRRAIEAEGAKVGMKGMPILHDGGKVKKDGPHMLKKGETVRTAEQEKDVEEKMKKASPKALMTSEDKPAKGKTEKKGKKHAHKIEIEKKEGGYLSRTHHKAEMGQTSSDPLETVHPDLDSVQDHIQQHMGEPNDAAAEPMAAPAAAPASPAGAPPPGM